MKKSITTLVFLALFSLSVLADGDLPGGGKQCQSGCLIGSSATGNTVDKTPQSDLIVFVQDLLRKIFV